MISKLRQSLKEDLWKIINRKETEEKDLEFFIRIIFYLLLETNSFTLEEVIKLSNKMKEAYENSLEEAKENLILDYGEILKLLNTTIEGFKNKIEPIINEIKMIKEII